MGHLLLSILDVGCRHLALALYVLVEAGVWMGLLAQQRNIFDGLQFGWIAKESVEG